MEIVEKVKERESKSRQELLLKRFRGGNLLGKREGNCTPSPSWKFGIIQPDGSLVQDFNFPPNTTLSARKLGANLWEVQPQFDLKMNNNGPKPNHQKDEEFKGSKQFSESLDRSLEQATTSSGLRKRVSAITARHYQKFENADSSQQPISSASYCSSMEIAPYRPPRSPSSLGSNGKFGAASYNLKTSKELIKVLNRIWKLEEKHALNMSLIKTLKRELDRSNARVKELLLEKKRDQEEIAELMELTEDKVARTYKEQDQMKNALKSISHELEDERKLRKHLENLNHKLSRELSQVKYVFSNSLNELKHEKKGRILLEDLCDEFAKGIRDYEQEIRLLRQKSRDNQIGRGGSNRLILHISEAWLDERMQIKLADNYKVAESSSVLDRLRFEIETFLRAKKPESSETNDLLSSEKLRESEVFKHASESNLDKGLSLKQGDDGNNQQGELVSASCPKETAKAKQKMIKAVSEEVKCSNASNLQMQSEEQVMQDLHSAEEPADKHLDETENMENREVREAGISLPDNLIRNPSLASDSTKLSNAKNYVESLFDPSTFTGPSSPVLKWTSEVKATDPNKSESFSRWPRSFRPNTLQAKLLEARLKSQ